MPSKIFCGRKVRKQINVNSTPILNMKRGISRYKLWQEYSFSASGRQPTAKHHHVCTSCCKDRHCALELLLPFTFLPLHEFSISVITPETSLLGVRKLAQPVRCLTCKSGTHVRVEGENQLHKIVFCPPHLCHDKCSPPPTRVHTHKLKLVFSK